MAAPEYMNNLRKGSQLGFGARLLTTNHMLTVRTEKVNKTKTI